VSPVLAVLGALSYVAAAHCYHRDLLRVQRSD